MAYLTDIDLSILNYILTCFSCQILDILMPWVTALGNKSMIWIAAGLLMLISPKYRRSGVMLFIALAICAVCTNLVLKNLFARPRPCWIYEMPLLIPMPMDYSFPSGHTASSFAGSRIIFKANKGLGITALITALLISFSRLYLYVHYPSDVIAGAVIGSFTGIMTWKYILPLTEKCIP